MKADFEVQWSNLAEKDLLDIISFIAADSPAAAANAFNEIRRKAAGLSRFPERGRIVPELREQGIIHYREIIVPPWRIIYRISGQTVFVAAALDSRRNIEDVLLQRLVP